ncbi:MAG TPA: FHA domain-containing protein [Anaerolineae bacterium]|nr:FHA domain-containing protein [Anaerolineae bacterium]HIP71265.1 FHA domain-containing protein [Anaerolineae bacterium]
MSASQTRLDVRIDVFEEENQWAKPLASLKPPDLIAATLQEFRELEYLSGEPDDYLLVKKGDMSPLDPEEPLQKQLADEAHLVLWEKERPLPAGAKRPSRPLYLRDQVAGKVFKLDWIPAIIGRPDSNQPHDDWLAVNLESYPTGLRVSRRHAQITEKNGRFYIHSLSRNPTLLKKADGSETPIGEKPVPLDNGDTVFLERSNISLKFIKRNA